MTNSCSYGSTGGTPSSRAISGAPLGFGKRFLNAGHKQWGLKMQKDVANGVQWATDKKIADPTRVAIMGGSSGGYAALAGMVFTPEVYACGMHIVEPSSLITLLESFSPYWKAIREGMIYRVGDPDTSEGREFLKSISPLYSTDKTRKPLRIIQGANDPRVPKREADQMVEALKNNSIPVTYLLFPDEGHGFTRVEKSTVSNSHN